MQSTWTIRSDYAIRWYFPTGNLTRRFLQTRLLRQKLPVQTPCPLLIHIRNPLQRPVLRKKANHLNRTNKIQEIDNIMKNVIVGFVSLMIILLPSEIAFAFGRGGSYSGSRGNFSSSNRYGGSTSHSYGSTSHSNAYGGSSSHTAGQGTTHDSAYGTSTSHNEGGGTTHTNAYGGKTSGEYGEGATHTNAYGGKTSGEYGEGATHTNTYGGSTSAQYGQGATHTNVYGGTTSAAYGEGAYHTGAYGYGTAYHPPTAYYGYHPPATVNYYGSTCANCNGWAAAAAVTTAAVTGAAVASANANAANANANAAAASANAYNAGYNAGTTTATTSQPATTTTTEVATPGSYSMGQMVAALPAGCITPTVQGTTYYLCGNTWFSAAYGANGVYYRVVTAP